MKTFNLYRKKLPKASFEECSATIDEEITTLHEFLKGLYAGGEKLKENEYDLATTS